MAEDVYTVDSCVLDMRDKAHATTGVPVLNLQTIGPHVFIRIPEKFVHEFRIVYIADLTDGEHPVDASSLLDYRSCHRMWIKCPKVMLNMNPGLHKYLFRFVRCMTDDAFDQFVYYEIQTDNPNKPYYYMEGIPE